MAEFSSYEPNKIYNADLAGKTLRVRLVRRSKKRPEYWICEEIDNDGRHVVLAESALKSTAEGESPENDEGPCE